MINTYQTEKEIQSMLNSCPFQYELFTQLSVEIACILLFTMHDRVHLSLVAFYDKQAKLCHDK